MSECWLRRISEGPEDFEPRAGLVGEELRTG